MDTIAIVGPTATGKSALAMGLARVLGGEIVSTDSMAMYRGMDIGTAKPSVADRDEIPHHLVDIWDIDHDATVAEFQGLSREALQEILRRNRVPILVGGSGLYVSAVLDDLEFPGTDVSIRARLERELADCGPADLHRRLVEQDPVAAALIDPRNGRRIVRALEVIELTGQPFKARLPRTTAVIDAVRVGLAIDRRTLDDRIGQRVQDMWNQGWVAEVEELVRRGLDESRTAGRALGYRQIAAALRGEITLEEAFSQTIEATKRFARRQQRWFEKDQRIVWVDASSSVEDVRAALGSETRT
jgi:tRNA dimethylallyltransferase